MDNDRVDARLRIITALIPVSSAHNIRSPAEIVAIATVLEKYVQVGSLAEPTSQNATTVLKEQPNVKPATAGKRAVKDTSQDPFA